MYSEISENYDKYFAKSDQHYENDIRNIIESSGFDPNEKIMVLDFGCGTGSHALQLLKQTSWDIVCFDISDGMLSIARENF